MYFIHHRALAYPPGVPPSGSPFYLRIYSSPSNISLFGPLFVCWVKRRQSIWELLIGYYTIVVRLRVFAPKVGQIPFSIEM